MQADGDDSNFWSKVVNENWQWPMDSDSFDGAGSYDPMSTSQGAIIAGTAVAEPKHPDEPWEYPASVVIHHGKENEGDPRQISW